MSDWAIAVDDVERIRLGETDGRAIRMYKRKDLTGVETFYCSGECFERSFKDGQPPLEYEQQNVGDVALDEPKFCGVCRNPIGNKLTPKGEEKLQEMLRFLRARVEAGRAFYVPQLRQLEFLYLGGAR